jgi:hypothetical protein
MVLDDVKNRIYNYLPSFIKRGEILGYIITAISGVLLTLWQAILNLSNAEWTGKGLKLLAEKEGVFYLDIDTDEELQARLLDRYDINKARGTEAGIIADLTVILNKVPDIDFSAQGSFVLNEEVLDDNYSFLGGNKIIFLRNFLSGLKSLYGASTTRPEDYIRNFPFEDDLVDEVSDEEPVYTGTYSTTAYGLIKSSDNTLVATRILLGETHAIAIDDLAKNLIASTDFSSNYTNVNCTVSVVDQTYDGRTVKALKIKYNGGGDAYVMLNLTSFVNFYQNLPFAWKVIAKADTGSFTYSEIQLRETAGGLRTFASKNAYIGNTWAEITTSDTSPVDAYNGFRLLLRPPNNTSDTFYYILPQVEQKSFCTSFAIGTRPAGILEYPIALIDKTHFSISVDFIISGYSAGFSTLFYTGADGADNISIHISQNGMVRLNLSNTYYDATSISANKIYNLILSFDGTTYRVFLDNIMVLEQAGDIQDIDTGRFLIGSLPYTASSRLNGAVRNFAIWDRAITQSEILVAESIYGINKYTLNANINVNELKDIIQKKVIPIDCQILYGEE